MSPNPDSIITKPTGFFDSVEEFVAYSNGDHAIKKILVANNGIGAVKAIRSIRRWAFETFGNERTIKFAVMATPDDLRANAEFIRLADEVVDVPGGTNNNNYANVKLICDLAERLKVDAVMPLWGHASENPNLPTSLLKLKHRVTFIGPPAEPMMALGDKIGSTIIAQSAGVPTISWNGDDLRVDYKTEGIPQDIYDQANVLTADEALACCERIGYPVMIKASEGGGGKGIRKVTRSEDVLNSFKAVQGEIPGSPIFVMKMASNARHLEVQLLADKHGEAIALSGRDCSVQRRHQKIIEEGPPIAAPVSVFKRMENAAVALAKTVGYINAGTVEYLYLEETQEYAFLELNPRLQVEHPVTENILGLNLPACQLQVAMGLPLCSIGDIRKLYGRHPRGRDTIDFELSERQAPPRHCIAVRVTAENPDSGFQPTSGKIKELQFKSSIDVWGYFSVDNSGLVHEFADSQFGHIFSSGPDRESARRAMVVALKELQIRGEIRTTTEYIIKLLQSKDFIENKIDTMWLDGRLARHKQLSAEEYDLYEPPVTLVATAGAALQGFQLFDSRGQDFINMLGFGHVPSKDTLSNIVSVDLIFNNVKYITKVILSGPGIVIVESNGSKQIISIRSLADGGYLLNIGGQSHLAYAIPQSGGSLRMILDGHTCIFTPEYDPTKLTSTVAGKLARLLVADGSHVNAGDPFVEIEVMKMYMPLKALESGTVHFQMSEGATLSVGDVIATSILDDPDMVIKADVYSGPLDVFKPVDQVKDIDAPKAHLVLRKAFEKIDRVLDGYYLSDVEIGEAITIFIAGLTDKYLPALEIEEALSVLRGRIDADLYAKISQSVHSYTEKISAEIKDLSTNIEFPAGEILVYINDFAKSLSPDLRPAFYNQTASVWAIAEKYLFSVEVRTLGAFLKIIETYYDVEKWFDIMSFTDVVGELRKENSGDLNKVLSLCRSHVNIKSKNVLLLRILEEVKFYPLTSIMKQRPAIPSGIVIRHDINLRNFKLKLSSLSKLRQRVYSEVSFAANLLIIEHYSISTETRRQKMDDTIVAVLTSGDADRVGLFKKFLESNIVIRDLILAALQRDTDYQIVTMELYVRKIYNKTHTLKTLTSGMLITPEVAGTYPFIKFEFITKSFEASTRFMAPRDGSPGRKNISYDDLAGATRSNSGRLSHSDSFENLNHPIVPGIRSGVFVKIDNLNEIQQIFPKIIENIPTVSANNGKELVNVVHIAVSDGWAETVTDDEGAAALSNYLSTQVSNLRERGIRRVTFFVGHKKKKSSGLFVVDGKATTNNSSYEIIATIFTFRARLGYQEDRLFRHIEAPHAFHLDLPRLANFEITLEENVQTASGNVHLYKAIPRGSTGPIRYFARLVSFTADIQSGDIETLFLEALDHLGIAIGREESVNKDFRSNNAANHIFVNIANPDAVIQPDAFETELRRMWEKHWYKLVRVSVTTAEFKVSCRLAPDAESLSLRFVATNPTGFVLKIHQYYEASFGSSVIFRSVGDVEGPWDGLAIQTPYIVAQKFEKQRAEAMASSDTLYVYDWPILFEAAAEQQWKDFIKGTTVPALPASPNESFISIPIETEIEASLPENIIDFKELVVSNAVTGEPLVNFNAKDIEDGILVPISRDPGLNSAGMVAWLVRVRTPEYPTGREFVIIANDITHQAGSFGTKEDMIFFKASEYARVRGIPRLYIAANSGARIGMAESVKKLFKVSWADETDPSKGFKYIYLSQGDYDSLLQRFGGDVKSLPLILSALEVSGETRYVITDIIGEEPDLGVENLMGSGLIAGATSRAYDEIFTLTLVAGRTVGIGAYLVRLGQRTIQKTRNSPIILTGYQALNKLMGREIYTTNDQLGGPMIMFPNGVTHQLADTHFDSVKKALTWLSFVPASKGSALPIRDLSTFDTIDRVIDYAPPKGLSYDPRLLLAGDTSDGFSWQSGFLDRDSFVEALGGWAKTVVVGRGRLGGIPLGVIVTENRTSEALKPADPADFTSHERMVQQAGGVWFPDSAYKTAQALKDFNREGLPCIVFANWRGFSGGQRDMFDEVLKFGSMIVDALVAYQQPLFVYIPPFAELRGGAWVVVDSTINADVMEFYAAEDSRGGVLEAAGAATIKFRDRDIISTAHRLDFKLIEMDRLIKDLKASLSGEGADKVTISKEIADLEKQIKRRERLIYGVYQQVAVHFADLHDTPGRMKAKGVIRQQVQWAQSRKFFYWRLQRRLLDFHISNTILSKKLLAPTAGNRKEVLSQLESWFNAQVGGELATTLWNDDKKFLSWTNQNQKLFQSFVDSQIISNLSSSVISNLNELAKVGCSSIEGSKLAAEHLRRSLETLTTEERSQIISLLQSSL